MVVRRRRKVVKKRGSRTHGRGCAKRGRKSGEKGGTGMSGGHKHKWSYVIRYMPDYFGKHGFKMHPVTREAPTMNVGEIEERLEELIAQGVASREGEKIRVDLGKLGISKVLGGGRVTKPIEVVAGEFSALAKEKLEKAGGRAIAGEGNGRSGEAQV
ncbi:MAG: uL15 family ribosomal protein [Candidatus Hadarchaeales archaeon]